MGFADLIGHDRPIRLLKAMIAAGRLPHALLLAGPAGIGKRTLGLAVAQAVNCGTPVDGGPCGTCRACDKIRRGVHPDVDVLELEGKKKIITVDAVRDLRARIAYRPYEGRTKVFIIPGAERMQDEAANALLKTLEEPPPESLLILTTPEEANLLPTIVSRCLRISLAPLPMETIEDWLDRERGIGGSKARLVASMAEGCLGRVRDMEPEDLWERRNRLVDNLAGLDARRPGQALDWAAEMAKDRDGWPALFSLMRFWYRDLMILTGAKGRGMVNEDLAADLNTSAAGHGAEAFILALKEIDKAEDALNRFIRPELVFENLVLALADIGKETRG